MRKGNLRARAGVAIAVHKKWKRNPRIKNWQEINERLMKIELDVKRHSLVIIAVYAPNDDSNITIKEKFIDDVTSLLSEIGNRKEVILLGDFNARTEKLKGYSTIEEFGENTRNDNGERIIEVCQTHFLKITNGFFKNKDSQAHMDTAD